MHKDVVAYSTILGIGAFFMIMTFFIDSLEVTRVSSALFPRIVLGGIILLSGIGLWAALRSGKKELVKPTSIQFLYCLGFIAGLIVLLRFFGFIPAAGVFMTVFSLYMTKKRTAAITAILVCGSFVLAFGIHYIFTEVLSFILP